METKTAALTKKADLKKHVGLIHCHNTLSLVEMKISNALLFNAYKQLQTQEEHTIHIQDLCNLIGYNSKDYKSIRKSLLRLMKTTLEWNLVDKDRVSEQAVWNASTLLASASIDGPYCTYSYSPVMRRLLFQPELYGILNMHVLAKFKSSYGLALYENCIRFQRIKQTPWFELQQFRKLMGVEEHKYPIYRDFNRRVLVKAVEEVNAYSPVNVAIKVKHEKKSVVAIQFQITPKLDSLMNREGCLTHSDLALSLSTDFGFSANQIEVVLEKYPEHYIREKITLIQASASYKNGKIENLTAYLEDALLKNYQANNTKHQASSLKKLSNQASMPSHDNTKERLASIEKAEKEREERNKRYLEKFAEIANVDQQRIIRKFEEDIKSTTLSVPYNREGLKSPLVSMEFSKFLGKYYAYLFHDESNLDSAAN